MLVKNIGEFLCFIPRVVTTVKPSRGW